MVHRNTSAKDPVVSVLCDHGWPWSASAGGEVTLLEGAVIRVKVGSGYACSSNIHGLIEVVASVMESDRIDHVSG